MRERAHVFMLYPNTTFIHVPIHPKTYSRSGVPTNDEVAQTRCDVGEDPRLHRSVAFPKDIYTITGGRYMSG